MIILLSPAKTQNFDSQNYPVEPTVGAFSEDAQKLAGLLKKKSKKQLGETLGISNKLADLNYDRFQKFSSFPNVTNAKPALYTYYGDVYRNMDVAGYTVDHIHYAQDNLRILSGLYGILKPMDLIQPYRLEMSSKFKVDSKKDLYEYWKMKVTEMIEQEVQLYGHDFVLNVASREYSDMIDPKKLSVPFVSVEFKEKKDEKYKIFGMVARRARGKMVDYLIKNKINSLAGVKKFDRDHYRFLADLSTETDLIFGRDWQF